MVSCPIKFVASCLLIGSSSLVCSPALAQIPVTGGRLTGSAAFFVPSVGNTRLLDLGTRTLRLETPNGVTVDSRFLTTGVQLDAIGNRLPVRGDRGNLTGLLSGRAFDVSGSPVFFSNVQTQLNFAINSFNPNRNLPGTLITPVASTSIAPIFIPVVGVNLDASSARSFVPLSGNLSVGDFDANLPGGAINLQSNFRFGTPLNTEFDVPDTVFVNETPFRFSLAGFGIPNSPGTPGDETGSFFDPLSRGGVRFSSSLAVTNFTVQLGNTGLNITGSGTSATVIEIQGINTSSSASTPILPGNNPQAPVVNYTVSGRGVGVVTNSDPLAFASNTSSTEFRFYDALGNTVQGSSSGTTGFAIAGAQAFNTSSFSNLTPNQSFNAFSVENRGIFTSALVFPPPSLIPIAGGQGRTTPTTPGTTPTTPGAGSSSTPNPVTLSPTISIVSPRLSQPVSISRSNTVPLVTIPNPALPGSTVFPGLNSIQVPITSLTQGGGNSIDRLLSGQNLSLQDTLNLGSDINGAMAGFSQSMPVDQPSSTLTLGSGINEFMAGLARSMPVEPPPSPSTFPITGNNSIATDSRLNLDPGMLNNLGSGSMTSWVSNFNSTLSSQLRQARENPRRFTQQQGRRNNRDGALLNAQEATNRLSRETNRRETVRRANQDKRDAERVLWNAEQGLPPESGLQLGP